MTDATCKACLGTWPSQDHLIADLGLSKVYLHDDQFFPGWTVVVFKRHATELFQLAREERVQLMENVSRVAQVLSKEFQAVKINYELLGNQLPHIHWHVIPRLATDPAPLEPVWRFLQTPRALSSNEASRSILRIRNQLNLLDLDQTTQNNR